MHNPTKAPMVGRAMWSMVDPTAEIRVRTYVDETRTRPVRVWILVGHRRAIQFVTRPDNCLTETRSCVLNVLVAARRR